MAKEKQPDQSYICLGTLDEYTRQSLVSRTQYNAVSLLADLRYNFRKYNNHTVCNLNTVLGREDQEVAQLHYNQKKPRTMRGFGGDGGSRTRVRKGSNINYYKLVSF
jgi:hypothetical protein